MYATRTEMLGKAIWRHRIQENPSATEAPPLRPGLRPWPRWESLQRSPDPLAGGKGLASPYPRTHPRSRPTFGLASPLISPTPKLVPTLVREKWRFKLKPLSLVDSMDAAWLQ